MKYIIIFKYIDNKNQLETWVGMSLVEQPAKLQALSNYSRVIKPKKVIRPKLKFYRPTGH